MNYTELGQEYLKEAQMLKRHLEPLRAELKRTKGEDWVILFRRISMLNEMYLECLHIGRELLRKEENHA